MFESCWAHHPTSSDGLPTLTLVQAATRFARREHVRIMLGAPNSSRSITSTHEPEFDRNSHEEFGSFPTSYRPSVGYGFSSLTLPAVSEQLDQRYVSDVVRH